VESRIKAVYVYKQIAPMKQCWIWDIWKGGSGSGRLYCNITHCYGRSILALVRQSIVEASYVYTETVKQLIIHGRCGKFSEFMTSEITSAGFSGIIQQSLVQWSPGMSYLVYSSFEKIK